MNTATKSFWESWMRLRQKGSFPGEDNFNPNEARGPDGKWDGGVAGPGGKGPSRKTKRSGTNYTAGSKRSGGKTATKQPGRQPRTTKTSASKDKAQKREAARLQKQADAQAKKDAKKAPAPAAVQSAVNKMSGLPKTFDTATGAQLTALAKYAAQRALGGQGAMPKTIQSLFDQTGATWRALADGVMTDLGKYLDGLVSSGKKRPTRGALATALASSWGAKSWWHYVDETWSG